MNTVQFAKFMGTFWLATTAFSVGSTPAYAQGCMYDGRPFGEGAEVCQAETKMKCINSRWESRGACGGALPPTAAVIHVTGGRYGYDDQWHRIVERVQQECEGKGRCSFPMTNFWLGYDPFPGKPKSALIVYVCMRDRQPLGEPRQLPLNEGQQATLFCS